MKRILITGGVGFIGHHLIEAILKTTDWTIVTLDRLDTSGNPNRLTDIACWENEKHRVKFIFWDLKAEINEQVSTQLGKFDYIVHLAAGTHVDRSITDPMSFVYDNVVATGNLLNWVRVAKPLNENGRVLYFSTDEVFGPAPEGVAYKEWDRFNAGNPYSAAKAGGECLADAFANTYKIPTIVTHCMNVFGERQHYEKFVPLVIKKILNDELITIHGNKEKTKAGTRFYLHARNISAAVIWLLENGKTLNSQGTTGKYNVVGEKEVSNLEMAQLIGKILNKEIKYEIVDFHSSRPGHDLRYALNGDLLKEEGFIYPASFEESLEKTVKWTLDNPKWL